MMKSIVKVLGLVLLTATFNQVNAAETTAPAAVVPAPTATAPAPTWNESLQKKYSLTDAQMKTLSDSKLAEPQTAMVAQLAKSSGKSIEEVLKLQSEKKMGWGKLAKELGVDPKELGQAVSEMKRERNDLRKKAKDDRKETEKNARQKERTEKKERHAKKDK